MLDKLDPNFFTALFTFILAVTGICALVFARQQLKQNREEAQVQHLLTLSAQYEQEPMVTYRKVCAQKRLAGSSDRAPTDSIATARPEAACGVRTSTNVVETSLCPH
jgi:hypothetical protein